MSSCVQAEFSLSTVQLGRLQSAVLVGYVLGQVCSPLTGIVLCLGQILPRMLQPDHAAAPLK